MVGQIKNRVLWYTVSISSHNGIGNLYTSIGCCTDSPYSSRWTLVLPLCKLTPFQIAKDGAAGYNTTGDQDMLEYIRFAPRWLQRSHGIELDVA